MAVIALRGCASIFHLGVAVLAKTMANILPGAEFFIFKISIVTGVTFRNFIQSIIHTSNLGTCIILIVMAGSTGNTIFALMGGVRELCRFRAVNIMQS